MTVGGDCFQASEIVNILSDIFGSYKGEGGALVASAGTYIAVKATSFVMAKNGQFMIHKPSGGSSGNETEIENFLILLKNITKDYWDTYVAKLKKPEADFKTKWDGGDFWMTAQEAKDWGFVTGIKEPVKITQAEAQAIKACGCPNEIVADISTNQNTKNEMDLKLMAMTLGLVATATEEQVSAALAAVVAKAGKYDALKAEVEAGKKADLTAKVKTAVEKAVAEKRINAAQVHGWTEALTGNYDASIKLLDAIQPVVKLSAGLKPKPEGILAGSEGKTFEQLQEENPELLAQIESENPEQFEQLFADYKKRNNLK
jgi:hypothetical protein